MITNTNFPSHEELSLKGLVILVLLIWTKKHIKFKGV